MKTVSFQSAQYVDVEYELASSTQRALAALIDLTAFVIYFIILIMVFSLSDPFSMDFGSILFLQLVAIKLPWVFYNPLMEYFTHGKTLGKLALGIRVVTVNGERPGLREVFTRWLFKGDFIWLTGDVFVLIWFAVGILGIIFCSVSEKKQRMGDIMANTIVIKDKMSSRYSLKDVLSIKSLDNHQPTYPDVVQWTDEDMMLIKTTISRVKEYPNPETKKFAIELADKCAALLKLEKTPEKRLLFLETLLQDYVVLTR